jgi:multiple sugar transport system ATP-binding protein
MSAIVCNKLVKNFGQVKVVHNFNLEVEENEFVVFLGPSGCGKSTILRMIAGLEEISSGELVIGGKVVNELPPGDRGIAMVFQNYALYPHMTVYDNIAFGLRRLKVSDVNIKSRISEVAATLGLEPYLQRKPTELSGGQQQRVAIARAMIKTPKVFLFDEPLSNLDAKLRNHMRIEIARLHQHLKTTTIYVTHDQHEAMTLADRIVLLKEGLIEQIGTPQEIFERPRTKYVASFIGTPPMNLMDMTVRNRDDHFELSGPSGMMVVSTRRFDLIGRDKVTVGIRPSHLSLASPNPQGTGFTGNVELVEYLGNEVLVNLDCGGVEIGVLVPSSNSPKTKDRITLMAKEEHLHMFDIVTGHSLVSAKQASLVH